jgi:hypothetical protein
MGEKTPYLPLTWECSSRSRAQEPLLSCKEKDKELNDAILNKEKDLLQAIVLQWGQHRAKFTLECLVVGLRPLHLYCGSNPLQAPCWCS